MIGRTKEAYYAAKVAGICTYLGCRNDAVTTFCAKHRAQHSAWCCIVNARPDVRAARIAKQAAMRADKRKRGECRDCSRPRCDASVFCKRCLDVSRSRVRRRLSVEEQLIAYGTCAYCHVAPCRRSRLTCKACADKAAIKYLQRSGIESPQIELANQGGEK